MESTKKKALIVTTVSGFLPQFEMNNVSILKRLGYEIHYASNFHNPTYGEDNKRLDNTEIIKHQIDFIRSPYKLRANYLAYKQLSDLMNKLEFSLIHCHTPMGGVLTRLAAKRSKTANVIYTAHGFHFYKGAPIVNWLLYYPIEKLLANWTDIIVTITDEDYKRALKFKLRDKGKVVHLNGVGINTDLINNQVVNKERKRAKLGIPMDAVLILSVGELNRNKNHEAVIKALRNLNKDKLYYIICGKGELDSYLIELIDKLDMFKNARLIGYREDIYEIMQIADIFILPSKREGLSVALMEAMAAGLPAVCSNIRGNRELVDEGQGGFLVSNNNLHDFENRISRLIIDKELRISMGNYNSNKSKIYSNDIINGYYELIYKDLTKNL